MADLDSAAKESPKEEKAATNKSGAGIPKAEFVVGLSSTSVMCKQQLLF